MKERICEAEKAGVCFGCEASIEDIKNNRFEYYEIQKECETLKKYRERNK